MKISQPLNSRPALAAPEGKDQPKERGATGEPLLPGVPEASSEGYLVRPDLPGPLGRYTTGLIFSVATLGVGAVAFLDHPVQTQVQRNYNNSTNNIAQDIRCFGGACSFAVLGLFYAGGALSMTTRPKPWPSMVPPRHLSPQASLPRP